MVRSRSTSRKSFASFPQTLLTSDNWWSLCLYYNRIERFPKLPQDAKIVVHLYHSLLLGALQTAYIYAGVSESIWACENHSYLVASRSATK